MASDVVMPRLSDSMEEGTVLKWLVAEGDEVRRGEPLVEIETDKANMTYEADADGVLVEIVAAEGETLAIGEVIARIGDGSEGGGEGSGSEGGRQGGDDVSPSRRQGAPRRGESSPPSKAAVDEEPEGRAEEEPTRSGEGVGGEGSDAAGVSAVAERSEGDGRVKASPVARRVAGELGVELAGLEGSGPGGRIVKADVEAAAEGGAPAKGREEARAPAGRGRAERAEGERVEAGAKGSVEVVELSRLQRTVSRRMAESKATAPDFQLEVDVDMTLCVELRERLREAADPAPSFNDMIVKACANALRESPRVNGAYRDGKFELYSRVNVGIAVATNDALVVPTIFDADRKSLGEIARQARELIGKVRDGEITPPELSGGTFTVSNLGMYGVDRFSAIINPPQAAILTVGALKRRPVVDERGRVVVRELVTLTLVCDHRILYGADGADFLARVRELLEQPLALAL